MQIEQLLKRFLPDLSDTGPPPALPCSTAGLPKPKEGPELEKHIQRTRDATSILDAQASVIIRERAQRGGRHTVG